MAEHEFNLMIVDDIEENRLILSMLLEGDYNLCFAVSGNDCLDKLEKHKPDLILLDINMPGLDGYEVCRQVVASQDLRDIPIIFVSALVTPEEQLIGFQAGAYDYITKPVADEELFTKVKSALSSRVETQALKHSADQAMNIAMEAMVSSSELGELNQFLRDSAVASSYADLGASLQRLVTSFGLSCCFQFKTLRENYYVSCTQDSREAKLLRMFIGGEKFVDLGARTIVTSAHFTLLVKNMPMDDEARYGRIRDHLSVLVDAVETKLLSLNIAMDLIRERDAMISRLIDNNEQQFVDIKLKIRRRDESTLEILKQVIYGVEETMFSLGLEEDQEKSLIARLEAGVSEVEQLPDFTEEIEQSFHASVVALENLMDQSAN